MVLGSGTGTPPLGVADAEGDGVELGLGDPLATAAPPSFWVTTA